ncbi:hypothetical protein D6D13_06589 [Aureobasidium pullulans]|uniref:Protein SQS1 n=1 Tax=Aureobasidium pullulans TaxID=5580 RepID=A0A4S9CGU3_AURPU|nr:hypothetical protein D6D13_06589 [Aureobasidium pullulans]
MGKKLRQKAAKYTPPRNKNAFAFRDDSSTNNNHTGSNTPKPYFSLRDELQSTEKHEWTKESRLRDHKVSFVSAGAMAPLDEPVKLDKPILKKSQANVDQDRDLRNSEDAMAQMDINAQPPAAIPSLDGAEEIELDIDETVHLHAQITIPIAESTPQQTSVPSPSPEDAPMFFVDTAGDESLAFKGPKSVPAPRARAPSPARSSSSDEVVFRGRNGVTIRDDPPAVISKPAPKPAPKSSSKPATQPAQVNPQMEKFLKSLDNPPEWAKEMSEQSKARNPSTHPGEQWPSMEQANGFADRLDQDLSGVHASRKSKKNRKKQNQELGIDGDDIMLYDDRFGDVDGARAGLANYSVKTPKGGKKKKGGRKSDNFPDATLMADVLEQDAYGGFDVMDYDRPSLRKKNKGRKSGPLPEELGLSDSDLVEELQNQWANDRSKKASKKAEREELRQLGLLGKKNKFKPDMNQRYTEGITMGQVRIELQDFLEQEDFTTKAFPPMQKNDRKVLHEIANHFNLKSKSVGSGKNRAPVLIKTQRTVEWSEQHFTRVSSLVSRSYLKSSSKKPKSTLAGDVRRTRQMGGGGGGAAAYRNGDVVGHNASEIPATNFGRKLMEKMGWAAGMSLGKEGSGGLLVPVQATVKSGKAGLG